MTICSRCGYFLKQLSQFNTYSISRCVSTISSVKKTSKKPDEWEPVIGLEIHAQMNTKSKLFSSAKNQFMAPPNSLVSYFDAALPGTLPVLNRRCVEVAVLTALALGCQINYKSQFDRKHYFYPDLPQGYQITQYWKPIAENGCMSIPVMVGGKLSWKNITIERIQIEQDSGKSLHDEKAGVTLIDLNRAGVGLMEIVTSPDFRSAEEAATFVLDLLLTMQKLRTCKGKIAEGNLRVDANISIHRPGEPYGVRSEVKNIAGIGSLVQAIKYEIKRHKNVLNKGEKIVNETREFIGDKGITVSMRDKEETHDYRFMPEPNLRPLILYRNDNLPKNFDPKTQINVDTIRESLHGHRLPTELRKQLLETYDMTIVESSLLLENGLAEYFIDTLEIAPHLPTSLLYHWVTTELLGLMYKYGIKAEDSPVNVQQMAELLTLLNDYKLNQGYAAKIFEIMADEGGMPQKIMEEKGWELISDIPTIEDLCRKAIESQIPSVLFDKYRLGEHKRPKNKKAVTKIINIVLEQSGDKVHTKLTKGVVTRQLDDYFKAFCEKNN